jgi:hypothetical protein
MFVDPMRFDDVMVRLVGPQPFGCRLDRILEFSASGHEVSHHDDAAVVEGVMAFEDPLADLRDQFVAGLELLSVHRRPPFSGARFAGVP